MSIYFGRTCVVTICTETKEQRAGSSSSWPTSEHKVTKMRKVITNYVQVGYGIQNLCQNDDDHQNDIIQTENDDGVQKPQIIQDICIQRFQVAKKWFSKLCARARVCL